jgi:hypothetical protein
MSVRNRREWHTTRAHSPEAPRLEHLLDLFSDLNTSTLIAGDDALDVIDEFSNMPPSGR